MISKFFVSSVIPKLYSNFRGIAVLSVAVVFIVFPAFARLANLKVSAEASPKGSFSRSIGLIDQTPPGIRFVGLRQLAGVTGQVTVSVQANDDSGVSKVELYVDGKLVSTNSVSPTATSVTVNFSWNTLFAANGKHMLMAKAYDAAGNSQTDYVVVVCRNTLASSTPTPTPTPTPSPSPTVSPSGNVVRVDSATSYQSIKGWQASGETGMTDMIVSGELYRDAVLNAAVEMGINRLRIGIQSGLAENTTDYYQLFLDNHHDYVDNNNPTQYAAIRANRFVPINDDADPNVMNPNGFKWGFVDWQIEKVILPMRAKLAARGENLWWAVSFIHFSASNQLHVDSPADYGELILAAWNHIRAKYGLTPDGLEVFLEPDNTPAVTPAELGAMIVAVRNRLVAAGYPKPYITAPSTVSGPNARTYYLNLKAANPAAASYIDEIGYHRYVAIDNTGLAALRTVAEVDNKNTAMTEFGGATYLDLHNDLKVGKVSAWEQYAMGYPTTDNGYQYFYVTGTNPNFVVNTGSRTKFIRQYTKFIRAGAVMKGAASSNSTYDGLAFQNTNGTYVVPIKCNAGGTVTVQNLPPGTYGIKYTTATSYDVDLPNQVITSGGMVTFNMPAAGVATVYDVNYMR